MDNKLVIIIVLGAIILAGLFIYFNNSNQSNMSEDINDNVNSKAESGDNPVALFKTNLGEFEIELYEDKMPITAGNFIELAEDDFYDDTRFHRVISGFMIQGGDPQTRTEPDNTMIHGTGGPGYFIEDEFVEGEELSNLRGTISMANSGQPNSGGSQFFINVADNTPLDFDKEPLQSKHPVFGRVISGMDVVDEIANVETGARDYPAEPVVIEEITIKNR